MLSPYCNAVRGVLCGESERNVERPLSNNGCNGLAGARNRRESAFRSRPSCKPATRVGGDDRRRSIRLGAVLVVSGREEWAGCPRQEVPNFASPMRSCLIAHTPSPAPLGRLQQCRVAFSQSRTAVPPRLPGQRALRTHSVRRRRKTAPRRYAAGGAEVNKEIGLWPRSKGSGLSIFGCSRT